MRNTRTRKVVVLLGAPGTGKGTQAAWLSGELGARSLSTGQILRVASACNTPAGFSLRQTLASGSLVPDDLVLPAVECYFRQEVPVSGAILDGFPRTVGQAKFLDALLGDIGLPTPTVVHLVANREVVLKRLTSRRQCSRCGAIYNLASRPSKNGRLCEIDSGALVQRDDDSEGVILHRLAEYERLSQPMIEYYAGDRYHRVDGTRNPAEISREIAARIPFGAAMAA